jgi:hypothetical protein
MSIPEVSLAKVFLPENNCRRVKPSMVANVKESHTNSNSRYHDSCDTTPELVITFSPAHIGQIEKVHAPHYPKI